MLIHLPQPPIPHLTSLGLVLKYQIKRRNVFLLPYKFCGRIKRKSIDFWINVLTFGSLLRGEVKTHYFLKTPRSWSKSAKLSGVGWSVCSQCWRNPPCITRHELSSLTLNFRWFNLGTLMHHYLILNAIWRGVRRWGFSENIRHFSSPGHFCIPRKLLWTYWLRICQAGFSEPVYPTHSSKATSSTKPLSIFPQGKLNTSTFIELFGWENW